MATFRRGLGGEQLLTGRIIALKILNGLGLRAFDGRPDHGPLLVQQMSVQFIQMRLAFAKEGGLEPQGPPNHREGSAQK
jgi:hypothetical protein